MCLPVCRHQLTDCEGHTANLWQGHKLLVYGGENEHREYLSDLVIFDLKTAHWVQPDIHGPIPKGRARHAAAVYDEKLFIVGGLAGGGDTYTLDEICYLDLKTWTWSRSWSFVGRFDHSTWVWGGRIWVFGGLGPDMERTGELWWLDLKSSPAFRAAPEHGNLEDQASQSRAEAGPRLASAQFNQPQPIVSGSTGYTANSSSVQIRTASSIIPKPVAPGAISSMKFISGPNVPSQALGTHFHIYTSGAMLDFVTPAGIIRPSECNLSALELDGLQWQKLAEGPEIFDPDYRWHYCAVNEDGTKAWLLGCANEPAEPGGGAFEEYLSDVLPLDLRRFGLLGNDLAPEPSVEKGRLPASDRHSISNLTGLGADLATMFDQAPDSGSGADFVVTAQREDHTYDQTSLALSNLQFLADKTMGDSTSPSVPIHVHKLILQSRWPHFSRVYSSQMAEFHTKKMHIPEPYSVVRAFLYYLYTDSIAKHTDYCPDLGTVAGLLVVANVYDMPRLRVLCIRRLSREMDIEHAAIVWERSGLAREEWLRKRAANYCLMHWGRLVRTEGFKRLNRQSMMELCEVIDIEGRVVGGEELEVVGGLGGGKFGVGGSGRNFLKGRASGPGVQLGEEMEDVEGEGEDDSMEMN